MTKHFSLKYFLAFLCICFFLPLSLNASDYRFAISKGQLIYVPAYSHIYSGDRERSFLLAVTLSIRNVDTKHQIKIVLVDYYETQGNLLKRHIDKSIILNPLESLRYVIPEKDKSVGSGANFMVEWRSEKYVNEPIVETIMIGTQNQQGVSFTSRGQEIFNAK